MRVFTNGCFDILHLGHLELLKYCKSMGTVIVGLNSDNSVRRLKGVDRPINGELARIEMLRSLRYVDEVHVFDEDTPYNLIKELQPDLIVKGGDYLPENVVGGDLAEVRIFDFKEGFSTTNIIERLMDSNSVVDLGFAGLRVSEIHPKGWGHEEWLVNCNLYCGKILHFTEGKRCSYHYHKLKTETFYLLKGKIIVRYSLGDNLATAKRTELNSGDIFHVPVGLRHQIEAIEDSKVFEFSTSHFESDSYRIVKGD